jgi:type I restriction enzyme, S subunit
MAPNSGSVDPSRFPDEVFDLYSIPAFDNGRPEISLGREIGSSKQVVQPDDVLLSRIVPHIRRAWVVGEQRGRRQIASGEWIVFRSAKAHPSYLRYLLVEDRFHAKFLKTVAGVGGSLLRARPAQVADIEVPLPRLSEQRRIAEQLEQADRLCRTRRYALQLTDTFLPAAFLELFGDPQTNSKGWDRGIIEDVLVCSQYGTSQKSNSIGQGYPVLGMGNITNKGAIDLSILAYVDLSEDEFQSLALQRGDIIFNRTNSAELVGKTACWNLDMNAVLASYLVRLRLKAEVLPEFFSALLNTGYFKNLFRDRCKKAVGQSNISPTLLKEFPTYIPPLPLQQKFAALAERVERVRAVQREALRQAEHLFASLLYRAFDGSTAQAAADPSQRRVSAQAC